MEGRVRVQPCYPLQEPLGPAAQAINSDPHLGERGDVQNLHDEGVILLPLKSGGGEVGREERRLAMVRGRGHARDQIQGKERRRGLSAPRDSPLACLLHPRCVPKRLG